MTTPRRFESDLPALLVDLYLTGTPDYRDDLVQRIERTPQRSAWTFPERWLPVELVTTRVPTTRMPWRQLGVLALIAVLLAAVLAVYIGSQTPRLPPPFGVARNGLIAYSIGGDVYTLDPIAGTVRAVSTGLDDDANPIFSPDGTEIAFERTHAGGADKDVVVIDADGSHPLVITRTPIQGGSTHLEWAPDSRSVLSGSQNNLDVWLYDATRTGDPRTVATQADPYLRPFRPPDGSSLLLLRNRSGLSYLATFDMATGAETKLAQRRGGDDLGAARWSPDGSKVVYNAAPANDLRSQRLFLVNADGTGTKQITEAPGVWYDIDATWSPQGDRIAYVRYEQVASGTWEVRPIAIYSLKDGSTIQVGPLPREARAAQPSAGDSTASKGEGFAIDWAPDGRSLIAYPNEGAGHPVIIDVPSGHWRVLDPIVSPELISQHWQRLAT